MGVELGFHSILIVYFRCLRAKSWDVAVLDVGEIKSTENGMQLFHSELIIVLFT
jgi:hypothetical protein